MRPGNVEQSAWKGPYMRAVPIDPWHNPYIYVSPGHLEGIQGAADVDDVVLGPCNFARVRILFFWFFNLGPVSGLGAEHVGAGLALSRP